MTEPRPARDAQTRVRFWRTYLDHPAWLAAPNVAHDAIARLDRAGVAVRVLTQNIDGLHQRPPQWTDSAGRHDGG
jgi:NAD-dependent deacetylase